MAVANDLKKLSDTQKKNAKIIVDFLIQNQGFTLEAASGVAGNAFIESRLKPTSYNPNDNNSGESMGLFQWHAGRAKKLKEYAKSKGKDVNDFSVQMAFLVYEDDGQIFSKNKIKNIKDVNDAAYQWGHLWERFEGYDNPNHSSYKNRKMAANYIYQALKNNDWNNINIDNIDTDGTSNNNSNDGAYKGNIEMDTSTVNMEPGDLNNPFDESIIIEVSDEDYEIGLMLNDNTVFEGVVYNFKKNTTIIDPTQQGNVDTKPPILKQYLKPAIQLNEHSFYAHSKEFDASEEHKLTRSTVDNATIIK